MKDKREFDKKKLKLRSIQVRLSDWEYEQLGKLAIALRTKKRSPTARFLIRQAIMENMEVS